MHSLENMSSRETLLYPLTTLFQDFRDRVSVHTMGPILERDRSAPVVSADKKKKKHYRHRVLNWPDPIFRSAPIAVYQLHVIRPKAASYRDAARPRIIPPAGNPIHNEKQVTKRGKREHIDAMPHFYHVDFHILITMLAKHA